MHLVKKMSNELGLQNIVLRFIKSVNDKGLLNRKLKQLMLFPIVNKKNNEHSPKYWNN